MKSGAEVLAGAAVRLEEVLFVSVPFFVPFPLIFGTCLCFIRVFLFDNLSVDDLG